MISLKNISENLGLISLTILIGTLVRLYVYYLRFNLNILPLIDLSEIPQYSIDIFLIIFVAAIFLSSYLFTILRWRKKPELDANASRRVLGKISTVTSSILMVGSMLTMALIVHLTYLPDKMIFWALIPAIGYSLFLIYATIKANNEEVLKTQYGALFYPILFSIIISIYIGIACFEAQVIQKNKYVVFKYENKIIKSNESYYSIGSTNNYYLMYNECSNVTSIFERDKISSFSCFKLKKHHKE